MAPNVEVVAGTYEGFLLGYKFDFKNGKQVLAQSFADKSHTGVIKCVAVHKNFIATGATDDRIFVYDMSTRKQCQILLSHEGSVNALAFTPDGTHLLSGGDDGQMIATRLKTWAVEATWKKAHGGKALTYIQCHPSGKLALSLGDDSVLCTWNLVKGRVAYKKNLKSQISMPNNLTWSPDGKYFALSGQQLMQIWSIETAEIIRTQTTNSKPTSMCWLTADVCLVGLENGNILSITITEDQQELPTFEAHKARVKAMTYVQGVLATASSNGEIKVWEKKEKGTKFTEIAATNIGCRPTCINLLDLTDFETLVNHSDEKLDLKDDVKIKKQGILQQGRVVIEYEKEAENSKTAKQRAHKVAEEHDESDAATEEEATADSDDANNTTVESKKNYVSITSASKKRKTPTKPTKSPKKKTKK